MGGGSYSDRDFVRFSTSRGYSDPDTTTADIYKSRNVDPDLDPKKFKIRESVDGPDHPNSTPLILSLDVTGSMHAVLDRLARVGMKTICQEVLERRPITDPHICCCAIGDVEAGDRVPFQASQFESDIRIFEQLEKIYLEGGGGGNQHESYILAWYFAKYRTKTDSFTKRGQKGFLFTIGDEEITPELKRSHFLTAMGDNIERGFTAQELYDLIYPEWNVFHIIIKEGSHARMAFESVKKSWEDVIGVQRVIPLDDHEKIGETIVSILELAAGKSLRNVTESWDGSTGVVVANALKHMKESDTEVRDTIDAHL
jgi:hypothetical protein